MSYVFGNQAHTHVIRDDGATIPWNAVLNQPADIDGLAGKLWRDGGSLLPGPYVPPTPDPRLESFLNDVDRQALIAQIATATPAQIKTFVSNNVTDLATAKLLMAKIILLLAMTMRS